MTLFAIKAPPRSGPLGKIRGTWGCIGLSIITLGLYTWYWYAKTHEEMKLHTGEGIGGAWALLIAVVSTFTLPVIPFLTSHEVGRLYERAGRTKPVSALTGLWFLLLGWILVGAIIWFVNTNNALNDYWRAVGADRPAR